MKRKKLLLIIGAVLLTLFIVATGGVLLVYRILKPLYSYQPPPTPPELREARIVVGQGFLIRSQFLKTSKSPLPELDPSFIGTIEDLAVGEFDSHPGIDIIAAGRNGAMVVDRMGVPQSSVKFDFETKQIKVGPFKSPAPRGMLGNIQIIDIEHDGVSEYLTTGSIDGAAVFDHQGKRLMSILPSKDYGLTLTAGDLNGDGVAELVAGRDGIEAFDRNGKKIWRQAMKYPPDQIAVVDVDGDGKGEVVTVDVKITIRDSNGNQLKGIENPAGYVSKFRLCPRPGQKVPELLMLEDGYVWLVDLEGKATDKFAAPLSSFNDPHEEDGHVFTTSVYQAKGLWVKLLKDEPEYLAVVTEFAALDRSVLYIYSTAGALVYQEVLPEASSSIAVLPSDNAARPSELLVGGSESVWRYSVK